MSDDLVKRLRGWAKDIQEGSTAIWAMDQDLKEAADRIEELEAKLVKAVEALELLHDNVVQAWPSVAYLGPVANASTTLAELTGGKDE